MNEYKFIPPIFECMPEQLRHINRWVVWRAEGHEGQKPRKVPYKPRRPMARASTTSPSDYGTFEEAQKAWTHGDFTGIGFVLNGDGIVGVDIDNCVVDGIPNQQAMDLLDRLGAGYVEISPSGNGLRALGYGEQLDSGVNGSLNGLKAEFYCTARYLTLTGNTIRAGALDQLSGFKALAESFRAAKKKPKEKAFGNFVPDQRYEAMLKGILTGDVYHDNLRDLAASFVASEMQPGAVVNHIRALMLASDAPHDDRWRARYAQIPDLVNSAVAKFNAINEQSALKDVSVTDVLVSPSPVTEFVWHGYVPKGVVTMLSAHGGTGKSTIALMLSVCTALGRPLFGVQTKKCRTLFASLEDSGHIVRNRLAKICQDWGIDPAQLGGDLLILDGTERPELFEAASRNESGPTQSYDELCRYIKSYDVEFVVLDNASDAYGGDEIVRRQVRSFMRSLIAMARLTDCGVLLLAHVDKGTSRQNPSNGENYSGSTAWHNSARSRLFLSRDTQGLLKLEHQKSNLGRMHDPLRLVWHAGALPEADLISDSGFVDMTRVRVLLELIAEYEKREEYCSPASNSPNNVNSLLGSDSKFKNLRLTKGDSKQLVVLCHREGWLTKLQFKDRHRNSRERWTLTAEGLALIETSALSASSSETNANQLNATDAASAASTDAGGMGGTAHAEHDARS